jgi:hypothetical protein
MSTPYNTTLVLSDVEIGVMVSVNVLFSVGGTIGNLCVCFAFLLYRHLRNNMNIFIFSLACSDLLVCMIAQPMFIYKLLQNLPQEHTTTLLEDIRKRLTWVSLLASIGNLVGVTLDRYCIISNPFRYAVRVTTKSACVLVAVIWIIASVLGIMTQSYRQAKVIGQILVVVLLAGMIIPLYCRILCIARRHARVIHTSLSHVQINHDNIHTLSVQRSRGSTVQQADRNSLKTLGIISIIFLIGWFPLLILPFIYRAGIYDRDVLLQILQWANTLALCSSACNPLVYSWRDKRFRKALTVTYGRWKSRRSISVTDSHTGCTEKFEMNTFVCSFGKNQPGS